MGGGEGEMTLTESLVTLADDLGRMREAAKPLSLDYDVLMKSYPTRNAEGEMLLAVFNAQAVHTKALEYLLGAVAMMILAETGE